MPSPRPSSFKIALVLGSVSLSSIWGGSALAGNQKTAILVDKKTNTLHVTEYVDGAYKILKTFHATLGKVKGDKQDEGDLKTPEGIYTFQPRRTPPGLRPKFGAMAFPLNYPNTFDDIAGHRGSHIMLHATNEPERLKQAYDSEGCIVVENEEIRAIQPYIKVGLTPVIVFSELTQDFLKPGQDAQLRAFFDTWIKSWETKDLDSYIGHYHADFVDKKKDLAAWRAFKGSLNERYSSIEVKPENVLFFKHPKYSMITFTQNYRSRLKSGGWGHVSSGTKILYVAEEAGKPKIIAETFSNLMW